jgi:hypothetical protein
MVLANPTYFQFYTEAWQPPPGSSVCTASARGVGFKALVLATCLSSIDTPAQSQGLSMF